MVSVGTIVWLASELMFFAALFAMYFTLRAVNPASWAEYTEKLNVPFATVNTTILVLSSVTCQLGVFAAERGDVHKLRMLVHHHLHHGRGLHRRSGHGVRRARRGGPHALVLRRTARSSTSRPASTACTSPAVSSPSCSCSAAPTPRAASPTARPPRAIVVSYYWHFVDVVWIGLFTMIYLIK